MNFHSSAPIRTVQNQSILWSVAADFPIDGNAQRSHTYTHTSILESDGSCYPMALIVEHTSSSSSSKCGMGINELNGIHCCRCAMNRFLQLQPQLQSTNTWCTVHRLLCIEYRSIGTYLLNFFKNILFWFSVDADACARSIENELIEVHFVSGF